MADITLAIGQSVPFVVSGIDSDGPCLLNGMDYSVTDASVVAIEVNSGSVNGNIRALRSGSATITITHVFVDDSSHTATLDIDVLDNRAPSEISISLGAIYQP